MKKSHIFYFVLAFLMAGKAFSQIPVITSIQGPRNVCWYPAAGASFMAYASGSPATFNWSISPSNSGAQVFNYTPNNDVVIIYFPNMNGSYILYCSASNSSGTSQADTFAVNVFEKPTVTFSGNQTICQGSSTNLSASPTVIQASSTLNQASSTLFFNWSPPTGLNTTVGPNVIANPSSSTNYMVQVANGPCYDTAYFSLNIVPPPVVNASSTKSVICAGESVQLMVSGLTNPNGYYTWLNNGTTNGTITVSPPVTTAYTVTGSDPACSVSSIVTVTVSACTGIATHAGVLDNISLYPNPSNGVLTIRAEGLDGEGLILQISNAMGQTVFKKALMEQESDCDISSLPAGIYFVTLRQKTATRTIKLIRE